MKKIIQIVQLVLIVIGAHDMRRIILFFRLHVNLWSCVRWMIFINKAIHSFFIFSHWIMKKATSRFGRTLNFMQMICYRDLIFFKFKTFLMFVVYFSKFHCKILEYFISWSAYWSEFIFLLSSRSISFNARF